MKKNIIRSIILVIAYIIGYYIYKEVNMPDIAKYIVTVSYGSIVTIFYSMSLDIF